MGSPLSSSLLSERRGAGTSPLPAPVVGQILLMGEVLAQIMREVDDDGTLGMAA